MENVKKIVGDNIAAVHKSSKTFKDIHSVMFSHKDNVACEFLENHFVKKITYRELGEQINGFAAFLRENFPQSVGEYIGLDLKNSAEFLIAFWGILQSGNKPYLINSFYPEALKHKLLTKLEVKIVVTNFGCYSDFQVVDPYECSYPALSEGLSTEWANEIALSSSLTGLDAKICVFNGEAVVAQVNAAVSFLKRNHWLGLGYNGKIKILALLPFFHIYGLMASYFLLCFFGRTLVFLQDMSSDVVRGVVNRHEVTHIFAPPILFHKLYKGITKTLSQESEKTRKKFDMGMKIAHTIQNISPLLGVSISKKIFKEVTDATFGNSIRFMISGGAHIDKEALKLINGIGYPLFNGYGTTETAITSVELRKKIKHRVSGSVGAPFDGITYSVSDENTLQVTSGTNCKKIISFNGEETDLACICTNDIVRSQDGHWFVEGRRNDLFIGENGENISPDVIQNELKVKNANNFSVLDIDGKLSLVLEYNEAFPDLIIQKEAEGIKQSLRSIHYGLEVRDIYITRDKIANDNAVKISRANLLKMVGEGRVRLEKYDGSVKSSKEEPKVEQSKENRHQNSARTSLPSTIEPSATEDTEASILMVKQMFQRALDTTEDIDVSANFFFDLGGTSLDYFTLINDISASFNVNINLEQKNNLYTILDFHKYLMEVL